MKKPFLAVMIAAVFSACNNAGESAKTTDSTSPKDNTNMYDTGMGKSMADTSHRVDTSLLPNKMQDTGMKK